MSTAQLIAKRMGGDWHGSYGLFPAPGHSRKDRSVSIMDAEAIGDGIVLHSFSGEDVLAIKDHLRSLGLLPERNRQHREFVPRTVTPATDDSAKTAWAFDLWKETRPLPGTLGTVYLQRRGLRSDNLEHVIRFHPACPFGRGERHPCIIALFRDILTNEPCGIHRTALTPDGQKIDRKMLGRSKGAAIKIDDEVTHGLGLAEGIETALTVLQSGWAPVWALGSAGSIRDFPDMRIECVTIFADNDPAGLMAARSLAQRWAEAGREAFVQIPLTAGTDFNDVVKEFRHA